ncbi:hypothetical protein BT93_L4722 [Corymbia citriodora subsp. variegata]|uniref:Suppressor of anucleate metulae protein B n=1 Tax=Corymbia citriodora subsp. variegata TaxID=360336 RepID=A0A8T0CGL8_CORYI|nr:hypothetical protein BT93_L4722 [Corymbia citriodora subsp. variegata]
MDDNSFPCNVSVRPSPGKGKGLFASGMLAAGDILLFIPRPLITVLDIPRLDDTCANCFERSSEQLGLYVKACVGCNKIKYCGKKCQSQSWKRVHKYECKIFKRDDIPPLPHAVRAALQLAMHMENHVLSAVEKENVAQMATFRTSKSDLYDVQIVLSAVRDIAARCGTPRLDDRQAEIYVGQILRNSLALTADTLETLGIAIDPMVCSANHSCDPNATVVFNGASILLRALKPIVKDAEVCISYVDTSRPYSIRQETLFESYAFKCQCEKCILGPTQKEDNFIQPATRLAERWTTIPGLSTLATNSPLHSAYYVGDSKDKILLGQAQGFLFEKLRLAQSEHDRKTAIRILTEIMETCSRSGVWPVYRQPYPDARHGLAWNLQQVGDLPSALGHMITMYLYINPVLYPQETHPIRVVQIWHLMRMCSKLYAERDSPWVSTMHAQGFDFVVIIWRLLKEMDMLLEKSHGRFTSLWQGVQALMLSMQEEIIGTSEDNLLLIEQDPHDCWGMFKSLAAP